MPLLIDGRVGSVDLAVPLREMGIDVEVTTLDYADIAFMGHGDNDVMVSIGIEMKKLPDLLSSLRTGRLSGHQLPGLLAAYDHVILLIEGVWKPDAQGRITVPGRWAKGYTVLPGMPVSEMEKRVTTLDFCGGMRVRHTPSRAVTLHVIANAYRWWTDGKERHQSHLTPHTAHSFLPLSEFRQAVMKWPHIGVKASKAVEDYFSGSIEDAVTASIDDWAEVITFDKKGNPRRLGTKAATDIKRFFKGLK